MYYNSLKETVKQPALLPSLAGFINPATVIPAIFISIIAFISFSILKSNENLGAENERFIADKKALNTELEEHIHDDEYEEIEDEEEPSEEPFNSGILATKSTVPAAVPQPLNSTAHSGYSNGSNTVENLSDEALKKEMIRQTMSELGKRSAAARARKRLES